MKCNKLTILVLAAWLGCGCANYRPHTKTEKYYFGAMVAGQAADAITTKYGTNRGLEEMNPTYGKDPDIALIVAVKLGLIGILYGLGQVDPKHRKFYYGVGAISGGGAAVWNYYQIERHDD